jgi:hypothetical protein
MVLVTLNRVPTLIATAPEITTLVNSPDVGAGVTVRPAGDDADQLEDVIESPTARRGVQLIEESRTSPGAIGSQAII